MVYNKATEESEGVKIMTEKVVKKEIRAKFVRKGPEFMKAVDAIAEDKSYDDRSFRRQVKRLLGRIEGE